MNIRDIQYIKKTFEYDNGKLYWCADVNRSKAWNTRFAGKVAGSKSKDNYTLISSRIGTRKKISISAHRIIFAMHNGYWPTEIDHINSNRTDNRIENLREVTSSQNNMNMKWRSGSKTNFRGVSLTHKGNRFRARIKADCVEYHLGTFDKLKDATNAYNVAAKQLHGEYRHGF